MKEVYFTDTVRCMLGQNSNCVMNGNLRLGPKCAACGFNLNVHKQRISKIKQGGMVELKNGKYGLAV